jgi:CheY-like chemotaxis protein
MDKREHTRVPFSEEVMINGSSRVRGIDISEGGLFVHGRDIPEGQLLNVSFMLDFCRLTVKVKVSNAQMSVGVGLTFIDLDESQKRTISSFVEKYAKDTLVARKKKVLLVEDNETSRRMNKSRLVRDGFFVIEACDGIDAIAKLDQCLPDLVVLDLNMDRMNGFKVLSFLKGNSVMKEIPVVVLSVVSLDADIDRVMSLGAECFLPKMVTSPAKLSEFVTKFLSDPEMSPE